MTSGSEARPTARSVQVRETGIRNQLPESDKRAGRAAELDPNRVASPLRAKSCLSRRAKGFDDPARHNNPARGNGLFKSSRPDHSGRLSPTPPGPGCRFGCGACRRRWALLVGVARECSYSLGTDTSAARRRPWTLSSVPTHTGLTRCLLTRGRRLAGEAA